MTSFADPGSYQPEGDDTRNVHVNLDADVSGYTRSVGEAQQQTAALNDSVVKLGGSLHSMSQWAGKKLIHFAAADFAGLAVGVADAASLQHQLGTLRATSVVTGTSMRAMKSELDEAFSRFPMARREVIQLAETINSLGVTAPKAVGSAITTFTKLGAATGENPNTMAGSGIQLGRMMGNADPRQLERYANSLLVVSKQQGVAASGVSEFSQAIAPMARAAGIGQAAVQGISAAFQKAGADGAYAANTFNQVVTEITRLSQTGSPELAKYANFVGKNTEQFRAMSGTDQITQVFNAIAKGGPEANTFVANLGLGPRAVRSVQAVAQGGGLQQAIQQAEGGATNTKALDDASKAALHGLSDSTMRLGNEFTKLGEQIGDPLLGPLTLLTDGITKGMTLINKVVDAMGPIPAIIGTIAGALALPAGIALGHLGVIGTLALGRTLLGPRSAVRASLRAGRAAGAAMVGGATEAEAMQLTPIGQRIAAGGAPLRYTAPFEHGMRQGQRPSQFGTLNSLTRAVRQGIETAGTGLAAAGTWVSHRQAPGFLGARAANQFTDVTTGVGAQAQAAGGWVAGRAYAPIPTLGQVGQGAVGAVNWALREQVESQRDSMRDTTNRSGVNPRTRPTFRESIRTGGGGFGGMWGATKELVGSGILATGSMIAAAAGGTTRAAARRIEAAAEAEAKASAARVGQTYSQRTGMRSPVAAGLQGAAAVGGVAAQSTGLLARGAGMLGGALFSPIGMIATMVGVPLISSVVTAIEEGNRARADISGSVSGAAQYDVALDRTSSNLAKFGTAVDTAAESLHKFANTPITALTAVTAADRAAITSGSYQQADPNLQRLIQSAATSANQPGGDKDAVSKTVMAYLGSMGLQAGDMNGELFSKLRRDILAAMTATSGGVDQSAAVSTMMAQFANNPNATPDFKQFGTLAASTTDIEDFKAALGTGAAGVTAGTQNFGDVGKGIQAVNLLGMGAYAVGNTDFNGEDQRGKVDQFATYLQQTFGIDPEKFKRDLLTNSTAAGTGFAPTYDEYGSQTGGSYFKNPEEALPVLAKTFAESAEGKRTLENANMTIDQFIESAKNPSSLPPLMANAAVTALQGKGEFGVLAAQPGTGIVEASVGKDVGRPSAQMAAAAKLVADAAQATGGDLVTAAAGLDRLSDAMGGLADPTGKLIKAAADEARLLQSFQLPTLSRESQLTTAGRTYAASQVSANEPNASGESVAQRDTDRKIFESSKENYRQYMISRIQQIEQFNTQQARSAENQGTTVARSNRDFQESQARSEHDYQLSRLRNQENFQLQSQRSLEDYQINVRRQNEDHARTLSRQAQSASQDIYDPYIRIQRKATTDAGTLVQNLTEQNRDIERQLSQVQELRARGLSQQAVDTLKLTDVGNAQQTDTLLRSLQQAPDKTQEINDLISKRLGSTTALTQSPYSMAFRQQEEDFAISMGRASDEFAKTQNRAVTDQAKTLDHMATDFAETRQRAVSDHKKALADMAADFAKAQKQAAEDLATSFKQYTGDFASIFESLSTNSLGALAKYAPEASKIIMAELAKVKAENPWLSPTKTQGDMFGIRSFFASVMGKGKDTSTGFIGGMSQEMGRALGMPGYATGGISLTEQVARVSEHGPELHLPLNSRGENFMAGLIARSLAQGITAAVPANASSGANMVSNDSSISFAGADIQVVAQDPNEMAKALAAKAKLARLASPLRH